MFTATFISSTEKLSWTLVWIREKLRTPTYEKGEKGSK